MIEEIDENELAVLKKWGHANVITCPSCSGAGWVYNDYGNSRDNDYRAELCTSCNGERFIAVMEIHKKWEVSINDGRFYINHNYNDEKLNELIAERTKNKLTE